MKIHTGYVEVLIQVRVIFPLCNGYFCAGSLNLRARAVNPSPPSPILSPGSSGQDLSH